MSEHPKTSANSWATRPGSRVGGLILAAGSGQRFGTLKQFELLGDDERLVDRAIQTVAAVAHHLVAVVPAALDPEEFERLAFDDRLTTSGRLRVVAGGDDRLGSVRAGLEALDPSATVVLIHDAAHPLASIELARTLCDAVDSGVDAAVPILDAVDVVKRRVGDRLVTIGRDDLGAAQVPMAFDRHVLTMAHERRSADVVVAEDSHLVELAGGSVGTVPGEATNIHVVDVASLTMARILARHLG